MSRYNATGENPNPANPLFGVFDITSTDEQLDITGADAAQAHANMQPSAVARIIMKS